MGRGESGWGRRGELNWHRTQNTTITSYEMLLSIKLSKNDIVFVFAFHLNSEPHLCSVQQEKNTCSKMQIKRKIDNFNKITLKVLILGKG